jgi:hypothetical protein
MFKRMGWMLVLMAVLALPAIADASGGSSSGGGGGGGGSGGGGGGGGGGVTYRITGLATAIDYTNRTIIIGQLYYGTGGFSADDTTQVTINNVSASFADIHLNDYCEVRYDATRHATRIAVTR